MNTGKKLTKRQNVFQMLKFTLFSISAGVIQIVTFSLLYNLSPLGYWPSYLIGLVLSVLYNFTVNRHYTFQAANSIPLAMLKVAGYYAAFTPLSLWWGVALVGIGWNGNLVQALTMIVNFVTEFLFCRFVVYGKSVNTSDRAKRRETEVASGEAPDAAIGSENAVSAELLSEAAAVEDDAEDKR